MANAVNFADPEFEPSDEQLRALSKEAFSSLAAQKAVRLARLQEALEEQRTIALAFLAAMKSKQQ